MTEIERQQQNNQPSVDDQMVQPLERLSLMIGTRKPLYTVLEKKTTAWREEYISV